MTVGPGITPDLLTLQGESRGSESAIDCKRSRACPGTRTVCQNLPPVGNFTPPWRRTTYRKTRLTHYT